MIILSTVLLIALNGVISSIINIRHGRNYAMAYSVFSALGITVMLVQGLGAGL